MDLKILELFSGIGGMHYAFEYSQLKGEVCSAMDINTVANTVYAHNHPSTPVLNNNIQKLSAKTLDKLQINTILMSPPCQPHTRVGQKRDIEDNRSDALNHICELLPMCPSVQYILMENVKGFEESMARAKYVEALEKSGFYYREFILTPTQMGIPNTRHRYYCIARKGNDFQFSGGQILTTLPVDNANFETKTLPSLLEPPSSDEFLLEQKILKRRVWLLDIVTNEATNTMCFTKAYTHYCEGTGSVYCPLSLEEMQEIFGKLKLMDETQSSCAEEPTYLELLHKLKLRYFTPREVSRLMCFPDSFQFPPETTNRQKYRLLGNSINVQVVGELIKLMCKV
ncbi:tRNA (cytosine(38)-C(5))-methyltransferase [Musca vetustissima]|uniref:tRNA (cytosine(38)-C(5))-methyltransferase n=1 Tax=Musca vetustissima TaxID=27455 RepID=UPI002AB6F2C9|nr:tRNA (cytosine(38)-C(5))-methyltransferase [Musca vetustissima]